MLRRIAQMTIFVGSLHIIPSIQVYAQVNKSYIREWTLQVPETNPNNITNRSISDVGQITEYVDGLGRPLQVVSKQFSPLQKDLVHHHVIDGFGRNNFRHLSFVSTQTTGGSEITNDGLFKSNALPQQQAFFSDNNIHNPISGQGDGNFVHKLHVFEASPLNRVLSMFEPGNSWVGSNRGVSVDHELNTENEVRKWIITGVGLVLPTSSGSNQWYAANQLFRSVITNEHGKRTIIYKDKSGLEILKKVEIKHDGLANINSHIGWLCTYYVYDNLKNLRFVMQPNAVQWLENNGWTFGTSTFNLSEVAKEQCFFYEYDHRNRLIRKKIPGAGESFMVYDSRDRLVMSQDANLRQLNKWGVTLYDHFNRVIQTGLLENSFFSNKPFEQHLADATLSTSYPFTVSNTPSSTYWEMMSEIHYDDYLALPTGLSANLNSSYINNTNFITTYNVSPFYAQPLAQSFAVKGLSTWTKVKVLGTLNTFISSVFIYDDLGRVIQVQQINNTGGLELFTTQYDFSGKLLRTHQRAQKSVGTTHEFQLLTKMEYDHVGRLTRIKKVFTNNSTSYNEKTVVMLEYDELGQLKHRKIGTKPGTATDPLETLEYTYNVRGWLIGMNKNFIKEPNESGYTEKWFGYELNYDKDGYATTQNKQYDGNIGSTVWKSTGDDKQRRYNYSYDPSGRLMRADFTQKNGAAWDVLEGINYSMYMGNGTSDPFYAYDANGNIKKMVQYGWKVSGSVIVDDLEYRYFDNSNKLKVVLDINNDVNTKLGDFRTSSLHPQAGSKTLANINSIIDYSYDLNGNLKKDLNKDIGTSSADDITYNHLDLPQTISLRGNTGLVKGTVSYTYDANGNKLQKTVAENGQPTKTIYYIGGAIYQDDILQFISHEEGRIRHNPSNTNDPFPFDYFVKDHLGNARIVLTDEIKDDIYWPLSFEGQANTSQINNQNASWENSTGQSIDVLTVRFPRPNDFGDGNSNGDYVRRIKRSTGAIGAGKLLKVMAGDRLHVKVDYYFTDVNANNSGADPVGSFVSSLLSSFGPNTQIGGLLKNEASTLTNQLQLNGNFTSLINPSPSTNGTNEAPKAYLNILFFNEQFKFDESSSAVIKVDYSPNVKQTIDRFAINAITAKKSGYVYIYFSNESETYVYFDNFLLTHQRSSLIEENHYYPFGLAMMGLSSNAYGKLENRYKFNEKEENSKEFSDGTGLSLYSYGARMYDPQIGRWNVLDRRSEKFDRWSLYTYAVNNPFRFSDVDGNDIIDWAKLLAKFPYLSILEKTPAFKNALGNFVSLTKGDRLGFKQNGKYSGITLRFESYEDDTRELGNTAIQVYVNKKWVDLSTYKGSLKGLKKSNLRINVGLNAGQPGYELILTGSHEFAGHALKFAFLINKLSATYTLDNLRDELVELLEENIMHKAMLNGLDPDYEAMNDAIERTISPESYPGFIKVSDKNLQRNYGTNDNTPLGRANKSGLAQLIQVFKEIRQLEQGVWTRLVLEANIRNQEERERIQKKLSEMQENKKAF